MPAYIVINGVVLRETDTKESDKILTLLTAEMSAVRKGEMLIQPRAQIDVAEQSGARVKIESLVLTAPTDESGGQYRARVEYSLAGGGWRPSEARVTDVLTGPTAVSLADENGLNFLGLIAMMDPPREESKAAVAECIRAGIRPIMITGDHKITAAAIAREIGILRDGTEAVEGAVIDRMSDAELRDFVPQVSVYARVSPEHKIRIVRAWQQRGDLVAMTGDGVNDAPALKQADIGVAMGITGTEVAKDAAGMVLADDNFATL